jgi:type VI secretion system secreted protein Hcp
MFLEIPGVEGESGASGHENQIDVLNWTWGMTQSGTFHVGGGGGSGKANFGNLSLTKYLDKSTPVLMKCCGTGEHLDEATLYVRKAGGDQLEYLIIKMKPVLVAMVSTGATGKEEGDRLSESVTLNFREFLVQYQPQDLSGAAEGGTIDFGYNIAQTAEV